MADVQSTTLYEQDFYRWALDQARAVRALRDAAALPGLLQQALDWDNLIEELEGLVRGVRSELRSRLATILEHLVNLELSTSEGPRRGWEETVQRSRREIELPLDENPSLRREVLPLLQLPVMVKTVRETVDDLVRYGEIPRGTTVPAYTPSEIMDHWWPGKRGNIP